jgi:uncharacterized flavoprotein (TIGR03862 family)
MNQAPSSPPSIAIIGAGPAGLIAAEHCAKAGHNVTIYDRMPNVARKFLMAGRGGLNLTHSEDFDAFLSRYRGAADFLLPHITAFTPSDLRAWCEALGEATFVGSSGRVFPKTLKASPLLRAWLKRLSSLPITFQLRHSWQGWDEEDQLVFQNADGKQIHIKASATLLALGGASWPRLGADGSWVSLLAGRGIAISPLRPANSGFNVTWTQHLRDKFEGQPLKTIAVTFGDTTIQGEMVITKDGIEGGVVYALSSRLRDAIAEAGSATLHIDLRKDISHENLLARLNSGQGSASLSTFLKKAGGLSPLAIALVHEASIAHNLPIDTPAQLAAIIKSLPVTLTAPFGLDRAISTAGGIALDEVNEHLMLKKIPGVFVAGEMLDWEAPTGGYLLQACFSTGIAAAKGINDHLRA